MAESNQPVIIKRVEDDDHGDHHGGGWKVAYADFMTAMMAFFLLLWILAASDEEKLRGLADYFTPSLSESGGRGNGLLDGSVLGPDGVLSGSDGPMSEVQLPSFGQENPLSVFDSRLRDQAPQVVVEYETRPEGEVADTSAGRSETEGGETAEDSAEAAKAEQLSAAALEAQEKAESREAEMQALEEEIRRRVAETPELAEYAANLRFDRVAEGLIVQIVDQEGRSMFALGSSRIEPRTRDLIRIIAGAIVDLPNPVAISGHTDSVPFSPGAGYSNWELSADRANATRRVMVDSGVSSGRIDRISGLADTMPLNTAQPDAAENRRISVLISFPSAPPAAAAPAIPRRGTGDAGP